MGFCHGTCCKSASDEAEDRRRLGKPRGCTDILCLIIFVFFWVIAIFVSAFAFVIGNPFRLISGYDSFGNTCGMNNEPMGNLAFSGLDMTNKPYVFYLDLSDIKTTLKICVKQCPHRQISDAQDLQTFEEETGSSLCRYDVSGSNHRSVLYPALLNQTVLDMFNKEQEKTGLGPCPKFPVRAMSPVLNRCIPDAVLGVADDLLHSTYAYLNSIDTLQQVVSDLYASWREVAGMMFLSCVVALGVVLLIHFLAKIVSFIIMSLVCVALIAITVTFWWTYADIKFGLDSLPFEQLLEESAKNERAFLVYALVCTVITVILLLIVIAMWKRVALVEALFKEAGACIRHMPFLLAQPFWTFLALVAFFAFWLLVLLALSTAVYVQREMREFLPYGALEPNKSADVPRPSEVRQFTLVEYNKPSWIHSMWWFHILVLIWTSEFILACQQMVIAGSVASWYFTRDRSSLSYPISRSIGRLVLYHLGSVALGSFLILLFKIPRLVLAFVERKLRKYRDNPCASCTLKCCTCCLWCLEKLIRYMNHNAYTVIAIQGTSFCSASRIAFTTLVSNALRVATINSLGDFVLFLGKCLVTALTGLVGVLLLKNNLELHFYAIPILVICIFAFFIAHCMLSVYEMVIDTLFLCFCEDVAVNDGSPGRELYAPESLREFLTSDSSGAVLRPLNNGGGDGEVRA